MSDSILDSIKSTMGVEISNTTFDEELKLYINSALSDLTQIGVGPREGVTVSSRADLWSEVIGHDAPLSMVKSYVSKQVKLSFDPPEVGFVLTAFKQHLEELSFRIQVAAEDVADDKKRALLNDY